MPAATVLIGVHGSTVNSGRRGLSDGGPGSEGVLTLAFPAASGMLRVRR